MRKPSSTLAGLFLPPPSSDALQQLLKEQDGILAEEQQKAIEAVHANGIEEWRTVVEIHWMNVAAIRVELLGVLKEINYRWADGVVWRYPKAAEVQQQKQTN